MSDNTFSLDSIREAVNAKYANTRIEGGDYHVLLVNALQLPKEKRDALSSIQDEMEKDDADQVQIFGNAIRTVATSEEHADRLLSEVGDNLAFLVEIFSRYSGSTQVGEA